ncbi:MAG: XRE family transcriptional regulator [Gordonia sp. (in: high G+C Gram-positive bacteria)]
MTQDAGDDLDRLVRQRIRGLRIARGWSLDSLAARCGVSPSTLSRIETGNRRIALDQLVPIAHALDITLDQLVDPLDDQDVVIRPTEQTHPGRTFWILSRDRALSGVTVAKMRIVADEVQDHGPQVHPGHEWFTVLSGTVRLTLGERVLYIAEGQAAEFSTMVPHAITAERGTAEILTIFDSDGRRAHLHDGRR